MTRVLLLAALALACVASPAFAAELATVGDKAVILPWGDWLVALAVSLREPILTVLLPIIAAYCQSASKRDPGSASKKDPPAAAHERRRRGRCRAAGRVTGAASASSPA
ncbi:hypothetical protein [Methylorubrum extorquens]